MAKMHQNAQIPVGVFTSAPNRLIRPKNLKTRFRNRDFAKKTRLSCKRLRINIL